MGTPVLDYTAGYQVGGSAQQGRQEVKITPACRPSALCPRPGPGLGSRSYSGAWESYIPWRKAPSQPPPPSFPPQGRWPLWVPAQQAEEGREGRGWRRKKAEACAEAETLRAGPLTMPKVPDPETASGRSSASTLISKAPIATSASSGGPTHEKARVFWTL